MLKQNCTSDSVQSAHEQIVDIKFYRNSHIINTSSGNCIGVHIRLSDWL